MDNIILLIVMEVLTLLLVFYFSGHDIMSPSSVMCIMFLLSTTFALLYADEWNVEFNIYTSLFIASGLLCFSISEIAFRFVYCRQLQSKYHGYKIYANKYLVISKQVLLIIILFELIIIYAFFQDIMRLVGGSVTDVSSYFHAYRVIALNNLKDGGEQLVNEYIQFALRIVSALGYLFAFVFMKNIVDKRLNILLKVQYILIIVLSIVPSMMGAGRSGILKILSALLIYYYICWHLRYGWNKNLSWKYIRFGLILFFVCAPLFYYSLEMLGRETNLSLVDYISTYLGSSIFLLDDYLKNPTYCHSWGEESLFGVKKLLAFLGVSEMPTEYNLEFRSLGMTYSNVYTFFRRPLHDFGYIGMYVFVASISTLFSWMYYKKIKYQKLGVSYKWIIAYGYLYYWLICSSIVQYSVNMISVGAVIQIAIGIIGYNMFVKECKIDANNIEKRN